MADLASRQAEADRLRAELSALRIQRENRAQDGHTKLQEEALDNEIDRLRAEVAREREMVETDGSADDAIAAMRAAAEVPSADLVTTTDGSPLVSDMSLVDETPAPVESDAVAVEETPVADMADVESVDASGEEN